MNVFCWPFFFNNIQTRHQVGKLIIAVAVGFGCRQKIAVFVIQIDGNVFEQSINVSIVKVVEVDVQPNDAAELSRRVLTEVVLNAVLIALEFNLVNAIQIANGRNLRC